MNDQRGGGPEKPLAVVVGHGEFAGGLVSAVGQICGMADKLVVLSMMGMTPEDIEGTIRDQLSRTGARVIFTDLPRSEERRVGEEGLGGGAGAWWRSSTRRR